MAEQLYRYPFNPHGNRGDCKLVGEPHQLTAGNGVDYQFIVPRYAPFHNDDVIVFHVGTGQTLVEGRDYIFTHLYRAASLELKRNVYGSITLLDRNLAGQVLVSYETLGGDYTLTEVPTLINIVNDLTVHRTIDFSEVVNLPATFPPLDHEHIPSDVVGMDDVIAALYEINATMLGERHLTHRHNTSDINGLDERLSEFVSNGGRTVLSPIMPLPVGENTRIISLAFPKVLVSTRVRLELWINRADRHHTITVEGRLDPNMVEGAPWTLCEATSSTETPVSSVHGSYNVNGDPILYLDTKDAALYDCTVSVPVLVTLENMVDAFDGEFYWSLATMPLGREAVVKVHALRSDVDDVHKRLRRLKINTLLDERIYEII